MKAYTDLEQSKKLAEILPLESADMYYAGHQSIINPKEWEYGDTPKIRGKYISFDDKRIFYPCWSLAALLNLCPTINGKQPILTRGKLTRLWYCYYEDEMDTQTYDNPVDAVSEMIQLLHEQKLL